MEQVLEFVTNHWMLTGTLAALLAILAWDSSKKAGPKASVHEATQLINQKNALVVDIRDKNDFKAGHLVDAVNVPQSQLADKAEGLEKDKTRPIIVVCKTGQTSSIASKTLKEKGYSQVYRLSGGIMEWSGSNLPLVTK